MYLLEIPAAYSMECVQQETFQAADYDMPHRQPIVCQFGDTGRFDGPLPVPVHETPGNLLHDGGEIPLFFQYSR